MTQTVPVPLWLFLLILLFAAVTFASHFLFPSVRWFFRKRAERVISRLNTRLARPIEPFKLARRHDMIQRLIYDPEVSEAIVDFSRRNGVPENVAFEQARRYAREIVPSFSATAYFGVGIRLARWLARSLYDVRLDVEEPREGIDPGATVIFVMNHRSNMDYVLVTYLVSQTSALSYAVGEWARLWPLSSMIRMMGAYFIRRRSRGQLYRRVLARYVQLATRGGVTQAVFPEGGLSLDGRLAEPRLGLLSYVIDEHAASGREVVFVPVALNYDRVLEDRVLVAAGASGERRFRASPREIAGTVLRHLWTRLRGRFDKFGSASVRFGAPLAISALSPKDRRPEPVAAELVSRIAASMPAPPVPLVARAVLAGAREAGVLDRVRADLGRLQAAGTAPSGTPEQITGEGARRLARRRLIDETGAPTPGSEAILAFYAASIEHHFSPEEAPEADRESICAQ